MKKIFSNVILILVIFVILFIAIFGKLIFSILTTPENVEILRITSPDRKVDVVLMQYSAGAMMYTQNTLFVVPVNKKPTKKDIPIFQAKKMYGLQTTWHEGPKLLIEYHKADIYHFRNFIHPCPDDPSYGICISEKQTGE